MLQVVQTNLHHTQYAQYKVIDSRVVLERNGYARVGLAFQLIKAQAPCVVDLCDSNKR